MMKGLLVWWLILVVFGVKTVQQRSPRGEIRREQLFMITLRARRDASGAILGSCGRFLRRELASPLVDVIFVYLRVEPTFARKSVFEPRGVWT